MLLQKKIRNPYKQTKINNNQIYWHILWIIRLIIHFQVVKFFSIKMIFLNYTIWHWKKKTPFKIIFLTNDGKKIELSSYKIKMSTSPFSVHTKIRTPKNKKQSIKKTHDHKKSLFLGESLASIKIWVFCVSPPLYL